MTRTKRGFIVLSISLAAGIYQTVNAEQDAHIHGEAHLLIALEGSSLQIEFLSPAMNIVGFEHRPQNETQAQSIESAVATLNQPNLLFKLPSTAQCNPVVVEVEPPFNHEPEHAGAEESDEHSEFTSRYQFQCQEAARLERIGIEIFRHFSGTQAIEAQSISSSGQRSQELTAERNTLDL
ncbi:MAG: DUF2796 domain-containing protein [Chromatiaceae bacterium]|nr:DUF2796 domain-containing protein [Gammaproteobacteria bacterium]MCB1870625.1 DUF2796 domain-containing protein [Gammaproteobacteria bacterium]MCB1874272.1 DUF2796 domain-containing protein [Gammaproteobacteria bacterium]MCB1880402.1 DUF2796 domain-containing protein [Gammaproteobacteria bacterium]MCP5446415.1 DUF2796 domain-containing protein [Chromatiaceae bacterium]